MLFKMLFRGPGTFLDILVFNFSLFHQSENQSKGRKKWEQSKNGHSDECISTKDSKRFGRSIHVYNERVHHWASGHHKSKIKFLKIIYSIIRKNNFRSFKKVLLSGIRPSGGVFVFWREHRNEILRLTVLRECWSYLS